MICGIVSDERVSVGKRSWTKKSDLCGRMLGRVCVADWF